MIQVIGTQLSQWDLGRKVATDVEVTELHFSHRGDVKAAVMDVVVENGMYIAEVPNELLQSNKTVSVFAVKSTAEGRQTKEIVSLPVRTREKPADYVYTQTEVKSYAALENQIKGLHSKANLTGSGAPTTATEGAVGQLYMDENNGDLYKCTAVVDGVYTWEKVGEGAVKTVNGVKPDGNGNVEIPQDSSPFLGTLYNFAATAQDEALAGWTVTNEDGENWSYVQGEGLKIKSQRNGLYGSGSDCKNVFTLPVSGNFLAEVKVTMDSIPSENWQQFALLALTDQENYVKMKYGFDGELGWQILAETGGVPGVSYGAGIKWEPTTVWMRLKRLGSTYIGYCSTDGVGFRQVGEPITVENLEPTHIGIAAYNDGGTDSQVEFTVSYLQVETGTDLSGYGKVKTVNGISPDENGDVKIEAGGLELIGEFNMTFCFAPTDEDNEGYARVAYFADDDGNSYMWVDSLPDGSVVDRAVMDDVAKIFENIKGKKTIVIHMSLAGGLDYSITAPAIYSTELANMSIPESLSMVYAGSLTGEGDVTTVQIFRDKLISNSGIVKMFTAYGAHFKVYAA